MKHLAFPSRSWLALAACGAVLAAEGLWLHREHGAARRAQAALTRKLQERDWLAAQTPGLDAGNEAAISVDLEHARQALAAGQAALLRGETGRGVEPAPTEAHEAYFRLARFVERNRAAAQAAKVSLRPEERFGFATYANEGPAVEWLPQVHRQLLVSESLVGQLIEAHPRALLALRREAAGPGELGAKNQAGDYFVLDRALSVRRPGAVETLAFRVEFSGQTATLRHFLTALAGLPQPLLVRSVEVEPLPVGVTVPTPTLGAREVSLPVIRQNLSRFTVIVESVLLASPPAEVAP